VSKKEQILCGLDIGTTKVCMIIARAAGERGVELVSTGYAHSEGLKKGVVVDLDEAAASIRRAAEEAELKSGVSVDWVTVGVSGDHVQSFNCHGAVSVEGKNHEVTQGDVQQVIHAAQTIPIPPDREIIHVLPQEFFLDNRGEITNPVGLTGSRLDVNVHVVTSEAALIQNLVNAVNRSEMRVKKLVLQQLASAEAVLTPDEKELGVAVVDIGGGTTDLALLSRRSVRFTSVLPVGGEHFTRDLAIGLRTPLEEAERIKKEHGTVSSAGVAADESVEIPGVGTRPPRTLGRSVVSRILRDRAAEVLQLVRGEIDRSGCRAQLTSGAVFTGGGSLLDGLQEFAEEILEMPVRQGLPQGVGGLTADLAHPVYATAVGLAMHGAQGDADGTRRRTQASSSSWSLNRLLGWVAN